MTLYGNQGDDLIFDAFSRVVRRSGGLDCKGLSRDEADFCRVVWLETLVDNGGFASFFYNSYGDFTPETLEALSRIGASEAEHLLRRAVAVFGPGGPSRDQDARNEFIDRMGAEGDTALSKLDKAFYSQEPRLHDCLLAFLKSAGLTVPVAPD